MMLESHSARGRGTGIIVAIGFVVAAVAAAAAYFTGVWPHSAARAENSASTDGQSDYNVEKPHFPFMRLEAQYAGPFQDTIIQRWRDPIDGRVCYLYLPVRVKHKPVKDKNDIVDYGRNTIGSISCSGPVYVPPPVTEAGKSDNTDDTKKK